MRRLLVLVAIAASPAWAQTGHRALEAGTERYLLADYEGAVRLLSTGLDPAAGPRDELWLRGVERLADVLLVLRQDSLAATWLRWAARLAPEFDVDENVMPPAVVRAARAARAFVEATPHDPFVVSTQFQWATAARTPSEGAIRLAPANIPITARIGENQFLRGGESRPLRPGSHQVVVSAPGYLPSRLTVEVLPGVTAVVAVSLFPETAGFLSVMARPWAEVSVDGKLIGYTPAAGHRVAPGNHTVGLARAGGPGNETPIVVGDREHIRVSWVTRRDSTGDPRLDAVLSVLDSAQIERGIELLRSLLGAQPTLVTGRTIALARLAEATWSLSDKDSAQALLRQLVQADPFYLPPVDAFNPELLAAYWTVRQGTPAIAIRAPRDTVIDPAATFRRISSGRSGMTLPLEIAVGQRGVIRVYLRLSSPRPHDSLLTVVAVDSVAGASIPLTTADGSVLPAGSYAIEGEVVLSGRSARDILQLTVERLPVDTAPHQPPLPRAEFLPETQRKAPSRRTILQGLGLGALALAVPIALNNADLSGRLIPLAAGVVGGSVALASIASGLPEAPIVEYVRHNEVLRSRWEEQNRLIAAENAAKLRRAPLRIRTTRAP